MALEGWGESLAFELNQFGIGINTVERGGMKTDFFSSPDPSILGGIQLMTFVGQQLRCDFLDSFGRNVQGSGDMRCAVAFWREGLHDRDAFLAVELGFQVFCRDCAFHSDLLADAAFDARNYRLDSSHTISRLM
jgi:NAD(P)-dependent dehydrogenase (short-subunit alcohol dehydrogenase family)